MMVRGINTLNELELMLDREIYTGEDNLQGSGTSNNIVSSSLLRIDLSSWVPSFH